MKTRINTKTLASMNQHSLKIFKTFAFLFLALFVAQAPLAGQAAPSGKLTAAGVCPADPCPCEDFFEQMSVYYFGEDNVTINVYRNSSSSILITTFANVNSGDLLVVDGTTTLNGRLGTYSYFEVINGGGEVCTTKIFSRCPSNVWPGSLDDQRVLGKTFGDFTVFAHTDSENASECTLADVDQDWHVGGNVVAATNRNFGTRNNEDVIFISNDAERGVITNTGEFGINTVAPAAQLDVQGDAIINETLDVNGIARMNDLSSSTSPANGALIVAGGAGVGENLNIGNDANVGNDLDVTNNASVGNDLTVNRDGTIGRNLGVGQNAEIGNDLDVIGNAFVHQNLSVTADAIIGDNATVGLQLSVGTDAGIANNLAVGGDARVQNTLSVGGAVVPAGFELAVAGEVICEEVLVNLQADWPDYVFSADYKRPSIQDWKAFIAENKHLPGVPSAAEVAARGGVELGETNRILLEKLEELTLIIIDQQTQLDQMKVQLEQLK